MKKFILILIVFTSLLNAQYTVERTVKGGAEKFGETNTEIFKVFSNGNLIYTIERTRNYDDPFSEAKTFEDGSLVVVNSFVNQIDFYSNLGDLTSSIEKIDDEKFSYEKTIYFDPSKDEVALLISNEKSGESRIDIYSKFGNKISSLKVEGNKGSGILFDQTQDLIVYSTIGWNNVNLIERTIGSDKYGNIKFQTDNIFSEGEIENNIFAGYSNRSLIVIDLNKNEILKNLKTTSSIISDSQIEKNEIYFVETNAPKFANNEWIYSGCKVMKYSIEQDKTEEVKSLNKSFSKISFIPSSGNVELILDGKDKVALTK